MFFIYQGDWILASTLFILANIGANGSFVFYDALLPHVAREEEMDRVSTAGYALGYIGGGTLLALNLAWYMKPEWFGLPVNSPAGHAPGSACVFIGCHLVAGLFDPAVSPCVGADAASATLGLRGLPSGPPIDRWSRPAGRLAHLPPGVSHADCVPDLQRWHRDDHAHGGELRSRDRNRSGRS